MQLLSSVQLLAIATLISSGQSQSQKTYGVCFSDDQCRKDAQQIVGDGGDTCVSPLAHPICYKFKASIAVLLCDSPRSCAVSLSPGQCSDNDDVSIGCIKAAHS